LAAVGDPVAAGIVDSLPRPGGNVTQGNRVKESCGDEACKELVVPSNDLALETE